MLRKLEINPTAQRLIDVTVDVIDQQGSQSVNLRKIAKVAGCAHTNVYNYFQNFDGLLWAAFEDILLKWEEYGRAHCRTGLAPLEAFADFLGVQFEFAMGHPGWYRFIWLEPYSGAPPEMIYERFRTLRGGFLQLIMAAAETSLTEERGEVIEEMLHGYFHGEICKVVSDRVFVPDHAKHKQRILMRSQELLMLLTQNI